MAEWTIEDVAARFVEAAETGRRLPPVRVQGYFNVWPAFVRDEWERYGAGDLRPLHFPPSPAAIERMLESMRWMQWLEVEQRHLIWLRSRHFEWKDICRRLGCDRTTAWRRWQKALARVALHLNAKHQGKPSKQDGQGG